MFARALAVVLGLLLLGFLALLALGALRAQGTAWAVVDARGAHVGSARFEDAGAFSEGLAPVALGGRWGYVDRDANVVIAPTWTRAGPFAGGVAVAETGALSGLIDRTGAWVLAPRFDRIGPFDGGVAVVVGAAGGRSASTGRPEVAAGLIGADGALRVAPAASGWRDARGPSQGRVAAQRTDGWYLAALDGRALAGPFEELEVPSEGLAAARAGGRWGYVDLDGAWVVAPRWRSAQPFSEGRAAVEEPGGWRWVDARGEPVGDDVAQALGPLREGRAAARVDGRWGFVDTDGVWVVPAVWDVVGEEGFRAGRARVGRYEGAALRWTWIDAEGRELGAPSLRAVLPFDGDRALADVGG
jgi:hypothetical protein